MTQSSEMHVEGHDTVEHTILFHLYRLVDRHDMGRYVGVEELEDLAKCTAACLERAGHLKSQARYRPVGSFAGGPPLYVMVQ